MNSTQPINFFIIPGNPPAVHFYEEWKSEILTRFPQARVMVSPYPRLPASEDSTAFMNDVTDSHLRQLRDFHSAAVGPMIVIGHSLGGHFSMNLMHQASEVVERVYLVHPFLRAPTSRGINILRIMKLFHNRPRVQGAIVRLRKVLHFLSTDLISVSDEEIYKTFQLAGHEYLSLAQDKSALTVPEAWRAKVKLFFVPDDSWCTNTVVNALRTQVATLECHEPHGFITSKEHRSSIFQKICRDLKII